MAVADEVGEKEILEKIGATLTEFRIAGVTLTDRDFEAAKPANPPAALVAAGPDFVAAWREYRRAESLKRAVPARQAPHRGDIDEQQYPYQRLLRELVSSDKPPAPEQLQPTQSYYAGPAECGTSEFDAVNQQAIFLSCLRHRRFGEAVQMVLSATRFGGLRFQELSIEKLRSALLTTLGFDSRRVTVGAWLAGNGEMLGYLCKDGSEESAQLVLRWAELHVDEVAGQLARTERSNADTRTSEPKFPTVELLDLVMPGNDVAEATKARVGRFLDANASRLGIGWSLLQRSTPATAKWLKAIARAALQDKLNRVRLLGAEVLHQAGEVDVEAELHPPARYRLLLNGEIWAHDNSAGNSPHLGLRFQYGPARITKGFGRSPEINREGIITTDPDDFTVGQPIVTASFYLMPIFEREPASPAEPWVRVPLPLPPSFNQTTELRADTVKVSIQPRFPRPVQEYDEITTEVRFAYAGDDTNPDAGSCVYHLAGRGPLVLEQVQPGDYWMRVCAPGAALGKWEKITVTKAKTQFEPHLEIGASVSIPLKPWGGLKLEALDPSLGGRIISALGGELSGFLTIKRDGRRVADAAHGSEQRVPFTRDGRLLLKNLPAGKYRVRLRSSAEISASNSGGSTPERPYPGWKPAEISFEVNARSLHEFTTAPLEMVPSP